MAVPEHLAFLSLDELFKRLSTTRDGIDDAERAYLLARHGKNELPHRESPTLGHHIQSALTTPLSLVLCASCVITFSLGFYIDALVICITALIHASISVFEDIQAAKSFAHVESLTGHTATVITSRGQVTIDARDVVPGDIIKLVGGTRIPADARILSSEDFSVSESAITGEWAPVKKSEAIQKKDPDSVMVWNGTFVSTGFATAVVVATGHNVKIGAAFSENPHHKHTPLQEELQTLSLILVACVCVISLALYLVGVYEGNSLVDMALVAVAVAVAAIPSGLPAMMTVVLARAMHEVAKRGGKIKSISAAETCGSVTYILTDKTGTLTEGTMSLCEVWSGSRREDMESLSEAGTRVLAHAVYASDAVIEWNGETPTAQGRPIEQAIVLSGIHHGVDMRAFAAQHVDRLQLVQFEPTRRYAISLNNDPTDGARVYLTGSPEHIATVCSHIMVGTDRVAITPGIMHSITNELSVGAQRGLRATAVAYRSSTDKHISEDMLHPDGHNLGFTFSGILFFGDKVRTDVAQSIKIARDAGIRIVMVTGDHAESALYVARSVGLASEQEKAIDGTAIDNMTDEKLVEELGAHTVFARLLPVHKIRIAHVLEDAGERVAMTGDGINDTGALLAADIGVVPESATDVAKDAADIILTKNRIAVIIDAIREGRRAFYNMQRVLVYLLGTGLSEVMLVGFTLVMQLPLPIGATQILWANMIQEGCMSLPFARRNDTNVLSLGPSKKLLTRHHWLLIGFSSVTVGTILIAVYAFISEQEMDAIAIQGTMFITLALLALFVSFPSADSRRSVFEIGATREHCIAAGVALVFLGIGAFAPGLSDATHGNMAPMWGWGVGILSGVVSLLLLEMYKFILR